MLSIPRYRPGVRLSWQRGASGELVYRLSPPHGRDLRLNPGMALMAVLADGRRTLEGIYDAVRGAGIGIADPAHVVRLFQQLEESRAVDVAWHFQSLGEVRHSCTGCGRSCEGHLIGPLSPSEIPRLQEYRELLRELEPELREGPPIIDVDGEKGPEPCLNTTSGSCVFFTKDRLCAIHKHFGGDRKPLHCQLFPLRVIETESGFRVGISGRCATTHRSWRTAPPLTAAEAVAALPLRRPPSDLVGLDPRSPRSFAPTPSAQRNRSQEEYFLALLETAATFGEIVSGAAGNQREGAAPSAAYLSSAADRLRSFALAYVHDPLDQPHTLIGADVRGFLSDLRSVRAPASWVEPPEPIDSYLRHALRQMVYLRELVAFGSVEIGIQASLLGFLGAMWTVETWLDDGGVGDAVGLRFALWQRMQSGGRVRDLLFEDFQAYRNHVSLLG